MKTLDEAIDLANSMNSARNMEKTSYGQVNYAKSQSGKCKPKSGATSKKCHRCGKIGHLKAKCRVNLPGGFPVNSRPAPEYKAPNTGNNQKKPYNPALNFECQKCHKKGHYTSACRGAKKNASVKLLRLMFWKWCIRLPFVSFRTTIQFKLRGVNMIAS